jgi:hypothetical protein
MSSSYISPVLLVIFLGLVLGWGRSKTGDAIADVSNQVQIMNQHQCVKDVQAAWGGDSQAFANLVALRELGAAWDASGQVAANQSGATGAVGRIIRTVEGWYADQLVGSGGLAASLSGYNITVVTVSWDVSAARAGANTCGREPEADAIGERLSPLNAPIDRRIAMRVYAMELVDNLGGKDKVPVDVLPIVDKILGRDYPRVIADN